MEVAQHSNQKLQSVTISLQAVQQRLIKGILRVMVAIGFPIVAAAVYQSLLNGVVWPQVPFYILAYSLMVVITFWKRVPYVVQVGGFVVLLYVVSIFELYDDGLSGSGRIFLFAATVFPVVFYGRKVSWYVLGLTGLILAAFGWAFTTGRIDVPVEVFATSLDGLSWVTGMLIMIMMAAMLIVSQNQLIPEFVRTLEASQESEQARIQSEQRFRMVVESSRNGIFIIDDQYKFTYANERSCQILGYSEDELIGLDFRTLLDEDNQKIIADRYLRRQKGEELPPRYEIDVIHKDGTPRRLEMSVVVVKDADDRPQSIGQVMDITDRRQAEQSIQQANLVLESSPVIVFRWRAAEGWPVEYVSDNIRQFGYTPEDFYTGAIPYFSIVHPDDIERVGREVTMHSASGVDRFEQQYRIITKGGEVRWTDDRTFVERDEDGNITHYQGVVIDVTSQHQMAEDLTRSEEQFRSLIESAHIGVLIIDSNFRFTYANDALSQIVGRSIDELIGSDFRQLLDEESLRLVADRYVRRQRGEEITPRYQFNIVRPDGEKRRVEISTTVTQDEEGKPRTMAHLTDVTEFQRLETEIREAFQRRGEQVQVSTEIAQEVSQATELGELFENVVTLTKERLGYYHTQLLQYDATQDAVVLISGYGEPGRQMAADGHRMPMGVGLIGTAAQTGETVMRPDLTEDPDWQPNPILPNTRGEIAVPIKLHDQILGVLDVQSDTTNALTDDDRLLLEGICGQVAIAMEQTRLRQEMDERLREINALYRNISREGWQRYRDIGDLPEGFIFEQSSIRPISEVEKPDKQFSEISMSLPGGEVIGALAVDENPENPLTEEDREFLNQVSEQIALALDGARLTEQTQEALGETEILLNTSRLINEALSIEELLNGVAELAPLIDFDSISLFRVASWDETNFPRTFDLHNITINEGRNLFSTIFTDVPDPGIKQILRNIDLSGSALLYSEVRNPESPIPDTVRERLLERGMQSAIAIILTAGERIVGFLALNSVKPLKKLPEREERILQDVLADQVSTYLENIRLIEQTRRRAESEALVNIIGQRIQSTTSVEDALQVAIKELGTALGVKKTAVQLELPRKDGKKSKKSR